MSLGRPIGSTNEARETEEQKRARETGLAELASEIKARRISLGISQQELASKSRSNPLTISRLERGIGTPTMASLLRILPVLGLELSFKKTIPASFLGREGVTTW